jgi:hypothetical protein
VALGSITTSAIKGVGLPQYTFTIQLEGQAHDAPRTEASRDDAAALDYARHMVRQVGISGKYDAVKLTVKERDECRQIIFSIPFLVGCA